MKTFDEIILEKFKSYGGFVKVINESGGSTINMIIKECMNEAYMIGSDNTLDTIEDLPE